MAAGPEVGDFTVAPTVIGIADGRGSIEPLVGVVEFRPRQDALPIPDGVGYTGPIVVELDGDGRIPGGTRVPGWTGSTCQVIPRVRRGERGRDLRIVPFDVPAEPGSTVFLSDHLTLWTDPSAGTVYVRGPRGEFAVEDREFFTSVRLVRPLRQQWARLSLRRQLRASRQRTRRARNSPQRRLRAWLAARRLRLRCRVMLLGARRLRLAERRLRLAAQQLRLRCRVMQLRV